MASDMHPRIRARMEGRYNALHRAYTDTGTLSPEAWSEMSSIYERLSPIMEAEAAQYEAETQPAIRAYTPTTQEAVAYRIGDTLSGVLPNSSYRVGHRVSNLLDLLPGTGTLMAGDQARRDYNEGNYGSAALNTGFAALDAIPGFRKARRALLSAIPAAASDTYRVGGRLAAPAGYVGPANRPPNVSILGERFEARPISEIEEAAKSYMNRRGLDIGPIDAYPEFSEERARLIAAAYDQMAEDPTNPAVRQAYDAMVQETLDQYNALRDSGIDFRFLQPGMPYPYEESPSLGYRDMVENGRLWVFPTEQGYGPNGDALSAADNPLLTRVGRVGDKQDAVANDAFRAVHDAFGHFGPGNPFFRRKGEENAFIEHSRMYSPEALGAMTSETRGQNSWLNSGPFGMENRTAKTEDTRFADQKIGLMPEWSREWYGVPDDRELPGLLETIRSWER